MKKQAVKSAKKKTPSVKGKKKGPGGRPTKYRDEYCHLCETMCAEMGAIDKALAKALKINVDTLHEWKKVHPEFSDALRRGRDVWDTENIEKSLSSRALGYEYTEVTERLSDGQMQETQRVTKRIPPDTAAAIFFLKNRNKARWQDKVQNEHTGADGKPIQVENSGMVAPQVAISYKDFEKIVKKQKQTAKTSKK